VSALEQIFAVSLQFSTISPYKSIPGVCVCACIGVCMYLCVFVCGCEASYSTATGYYLVMNSELVITCSPFQLLDEHLSQTVTLTVT